jgi:hypothetical protein
MHLANHGISGDTAKLFGDLTRTQAFRPKLFELFYAFVRPSHLTRSPGGALLTLMKLMSAYIHSCLITLDIVSDGALATRCLHDEACGKLSCHLNR